ncbi:unnamed protein product [Alopecurus aequalis]
MNQAEVSGLVCIGSHDTNAGEQSYATGCPEMNWDQSHETNKFEVSMATAAMHSGLSNSNACLDGYQHTGIMAERIQDVEEVGFGSMQHLEGRVSDSGEESLSFSLETSSITKYGYMEQNLQNIYTLDEMVDNKGPVTLIPDFVLCDTALHLQPHLTFSSDGFKIEHFDCDSREDDEMIALYWDVCDIICVNSKWTQSVESAFITLIIKSSAETKSSGPIRVEFCLKDPQWPQKQEKICYLASRYHEIWNNILSQDFALENSSIEPSLFFPKQYFSGTDDFEEVIYPKGERDAVSISSRDVDVLLPETYVNDTIIDFYIKYLSKRIKTSERCRYHFFNSFFFRKLADLDKDQGRAPEGRSAFLSVRKWTRKIDIFSKDFLFIPVNFSLHWSLIVICHPGEVVKSEDDEAEKHGKVPCILHMDSLKGTHTGLKDIIQSYLWEEWTERHPESALDVSDKFLNLRFLPLELPQQDNLFDCGLFLLHYVELFLLDAPSSFNPLKIDVFSTFLSNDWFVPAEASLKRSLIRKLIHELVTEPSKFFPELTCGTEQFDERNQRSENAEKETAIKFLAQGCSAGASDSVCRIPGTRQESTSICFNNRGKGLPVSGFGLETAEVTMFTVQDMQVCPLDNDSVVCLPIQVVKNDPTLADSDNQSGPRSCAPEGAEALKDDACVVKDKDTYEESMLDYLHNNQKISSQAEAKVHDTMDSKCCSFSDNSEVACKQHILETNINEVVVGSEDMHPVMLSDASKDDTANDPASTKGEAENGICDLSDVMGFVAASDMNGNASGRFLERSILIAEEAVSDISDDMGSVVIGVLNKDVSEHSFTMNAVESEDAKYEDTDGDVKVEDDLKVKMNETEDARGDVKVEDDTNVNMDETENTQREVKVEDDMEVSTNKSEDSYVDVKVEDYIEVNSNETEDTHVDVKPEDDIKVNTNATQDTYGDVKVEDNMEVNTHGTCTAVDEIKGNTDHCMASMASDRTVSCESKEGKNNNIMAGGSESGADGAHPDSVGARGAVEAVRCEDETARANAEMSSIDSTSSANNETVCEDKPCDAMRPLPDSTSEVENIEVSDKCLQEDVLCTEEKQERCRKVPQAKVMDCKQQILETNMNEVVDGSEEMHPVMMSDASKDDIANDPASTKGEAENGKCDLPDVMGFFAIGDINRNASGRALQGSVVKAEDAIGDISDDTCSVVIGELNKDVSVHSFTMNAVKSEATNQDDTHGDFKLEDDIEVNSKETEDTHGDVKVEDDIKVNTDETEDSHGDVKVEDDIKFNTSETEDTHCDVKVEDDMEVITKGTSTAVDEIKGNTDHCMASDRTDSCESNVGNNNIMAGGSESGAIGAHPDNVGSHGAIEAVPCEDDIAGADAEMPSIDSTSCANNETVCEDKPCDTRPLPDSTSEVENIEVSDDKCSQEDALSTEEKQERRCKRRKVCPVDNDSVVCLPSRFYVRRKKKEAVATTSWEDLKNFKHRWVYVRRKKKKAASQADQASDMLVEGGSDPMWGIVYVRRKKKAAAQGSWEDLKRQPEPADGVFVKGGSDPMWGIAYVRRKKKPPPQVSWEDLERQPKPADDRLVEGGSGSDVMWGRTYVRRKKKKQRLDH